MLVCYGIILTAIVYDLRFRKIPNRLILIGLGTGMFRRVYLEGGTGVLTGLISFLLPILFLYFFFLLGALGAGDIKLFSIVAIFLNAKQILWCGLWMFVIGGIWSFLCVIHNLLCRNREHIETIPFSVAILGGLVITMLWMK